MCFRDRAVLKKVVKTRNHMHTPSMNRRNFLLAAAGGSAALAFPRPALPSSPAPIKITEAKFLRLRYPGTVARRRNGTIARGGRAPGKKPAQLDTHAGGICPRVPAGQPGG